MSIVSTSYSSSRVELAEGMSETTSIRTNWRTQHARRAEDRSDVGHKLWPMRKRSRLPSLYQNVWVPTFSWKSYPRFLHPLRSYPRFQNHPLFPIFRRNLGNIGRNWSTVGSNPGPESQVITGFRPWLVRMTTCNPLLGSKKLPTLFPPG